MGHAHLGRCAAGDASVGDADLRVGAALSAYQRTATRAIASAHPIHALLVLRAAVEAFATVIVVSIKVYAPLVAGGLAFRAVANLNISLPDAVPRAALGVPPTLPSQAPAIVGPSNPWHGGHCSS